MGQAATRPPPPERPPQGHGHQAAHGHGFPAAPARLAAGSGEARRSGRRAGRGGHRPGGSQRQEGAAQRCSLRPGTRPDPGSKPVPQRNGGGGRRGTSQHAAQQGGRGKAPLLPQPSARGAFLSRRRVCVWGGGLRLSVSEGRDEILFPASVEPRCTLEEPDSLFAPRAKHFLPCLPPPASYGLSLSGDPRVGRAGSACEGPPGQPPTALPLRAGSEGAQQHGAPQGPRSASRGRRGARGPHALRSERRGEPALSSPLLSSSALLSHSSRSPASQTAPEVSQKCSLAAAPILLLAVNTLLLAFKHLRLN